MKILNFEWDNAIGEDHNGKHLIIGQHLPKQQNENLSHLEVYGISLDMIDNSKDYSLKRISCYGENIVGDVKEISKEQARTLLIKQIDDALEVMFKEGEINDVNENLNVEPELELEDDI